MWIQTIWFLRSELECILPWSGDVLWSFVPQLSIWNYENKTQKIRHREAVLDNSLVVQWLGFCAFTTEGLGSIPGWGTKIPQTAWCGQERKKVDCVWHTFKHDFISCCHLCLSSLLWWLWSALHRDSLMAWQHFTSRPVRASCPGAPLKLAAVFPRTHSALRYAVWKCNGVSVSEPPLTDRCVLNSFSHVWLFLTQWTVARQAPLSMGFSKQEDWSGSPCPPPGDLPDPGIKPLSLMSSCICRHVLYHQRHMEGKINSSFFYSRGK